jgi:hypothetical protein
VNQAILPSSERMFDVELQAGAAVAMWIGGSRALRLQKVLRQSVPQVVAALRERALAAAGPVPFPKPSPTPEPVPSEPEPTVPPEEPPIPPFPEPGEPIPCSGRPGRAAPPGPAGGGTRGTAVCGGIHTSDIPSFPYHLLWGERTVRSVANLTRRDGEEFLALAPKVPVRTEVETFRLEDANEALTRLHAGRTRGAAVLLPHASPA